MPVNINKLKGTLVEKDIKHCDLANSIGVSKSTLNRKFKADGRGFTVEDVQNIVTYLCLTPDEAMSIFFNDWVAKMRQKGNQ